MFSFQLANTIPYQPLQQELDFVPSSVAAECRFVQARRLAEDDPEGMVSIYQQLLVNEEQLETAIRAGDVFAALVDHFFERQDWQQCYSLVTRCPTVFHPNIKQIILSASVVTLLLH